MININMFSLAYIYVVVLVKVWPFIGRWCRVIIGQEEQWSVGASEICGVDNVLDISSQLVQGNCTWYYFWYLVLSCLCGRCFFSFCIPFCPLLATRLKSYKNWTLAKRKRVKKKKRRQIEVLHSLYNFPSVLYSPFWSDELSYHIYICNHFLICCWWDIVKYWSMNIL